MTLSPPPPMPVLAPSLNDWAQSVLLGGELAQKLAAPPAGASFDDNVTAVDVDRPTRSGALAMVEGAEKLPRLGELSSPAARAVTISRFAHHELMAVELFAWALLRFPTAPLSLRRGFVAALAEEQEHLRLYLARLHAHGVTFGDIPLSGYFWKLLPGIRAAPDPLRAFLCAQGLTLEQANLDFTILYRDAFQGAGDTETAAILQRVHDDEVAHVRLARTWLIRDWTRPSGALPFAVPDGTVDVGVTAGDEVDVSADLARYLEHVPFPLSAARAKGRRFESGARRRAGLSHAFIEHVRCARPYEPTLNTSTTPQREPPARRPV
jgi:uncharacterized ferritin-like protein (DUF455 family)